MQPLEIIIPIILIIYILWLLTGHKSSSVVGVLPAFVLVAVNTQPRQRLTLATS